MRRGRPPRPRHSVWMHMARCPAAAPGGRSLEKALLIAGVAALGFNLRGSITSLPPVYPELQAQLGLSTATVSLLAATPLICFGVVSAFAAGLSRRLGEERVLLIAAGALTCGLVIRGLWPGTMLFPGTVLASSAIAVMNVLLSSLSKGRWPGRAGLLIGIYLTALTLGGVTGSLLSVPLYQASGGSVRLILGWMAAPAALATLLWLPQARHRIRAVVPAGGRRVAVYRYALAWHVTAFMGLQSLLYFATLSWLPTILRDRGATPETAGNLLSLMVLGNFAAALIVPVIAERLHGQRVLAVGTAAGLAAGLANALYAPMGSVVAWVFVLGISQGAALALAIFFTIARAPDPAVAASLSSLAQAVGYLVASAGPLELGLLHSATGSWSLPVAVLFALNGCLFVAGMMAGRSRVLPSRAALRTSRDPSIPHGANPPAGTERGTGVARRPFSRRGPSGPIGRRNSAGS
jgi:CP family cyanate transporter-like MFS transporter